MVSARQPRYALLAQSILRHIESGRYPVGGLLPTEIELAEQFGMSRHTVREAIRRLHEMGLLSRRQGVGTRVEAKTVAARYVQSLRTISDLYQYANDMRLDVKAIEEVTADEPLAALLDCRRGQSWIKVSGLRFTGSRREPVCFTTIYINAAFGAICTHIGASKVPVYTLIEKHYGERVREIRQEISAVTVDAKLAFALKVKAGTPALAITRHYLNTADRLIEAAVNIYPAECFSYSIRLRVEPNGQGRDDTPE